MPDTILMIRTDEPIGTISPRLYGHFAEHIGRCCYEVGPDTREAFVAAGPHPILLERWFEPHANGKFHLDTVQAAREQLEGTGIPPNRIYAADLCTQTHAAAFHSYRVAGAHAGRMAAVIRPRSRT